MEYFTVRTVSLDTPRFEHNYHTYIAVSLCITVTEQLPKNYLLYAVKLTCIYSGHLNLTGAVTP